MKWIGSRFCISFTEYMGWQLNEAELILKTVLEDESTTSRKYLQALVITYFKTKKEREINNETTD